MLLSPRIHFQRVIRLATSGEDAAETANRKDLEDLKEIMDSWRFSRVSWFYHYSPIFALTLA